MKPVEIKNLQNTNLLKIRWCAGNVCNFNCTYCDSHDGDYQYPRSLGTIYNNFQHLFKVYKQTLRKDKFELEISGGEPTLWPELGSFVKLVKKEWDVDVQLISNGSRTLRWWKAYAKYFSKINFSFHHKQADLKHFINVVDEVVSQNITVNVMVLMDPNNFEKCIDAINYMKQYRKEKWSIEARPIFATNNFAVSYTEEQKKYLKNNLKSLPNLKWIFKNLFKFERNESIVHFDNKKSKRVNPTYHTNNFNTFKGWMCDIELENIYIHWNGIIQGSCGQKLFDKEYNIYSRDFIENFNPVPTTLVCERDCCFCQPETHISKFSLS